MMPQRLPPLLSTDQDGTSPTSVPGLAFFFFFFLLELLQQLLGKPRRAYGGWQTGREQQVLLARDAWGKMGK